MSGYNLTHIGKHFYAITDVISGSCSSDPLKNVALHILFFFIFFIFFFIKPQSTYTRL